MLQGELCPVAFLCQKTAGGFFLRLFVCKNPAAAPSPSREEIKTLSSSVISQSLNEGKNRQLSGLVLCLSGLIKALPLYRKNGGDKP
jgi:hypothetical protein